MLQAVSGCLINGQSVWYILPQYSENVHHRIAYNNYVDKNPKSISRNYKWINGTERSSYWQSCGHDRRWRLSKGPFCFNYRQTSNIGRTLLDNTTCWSIRSSWSIAYRRCSNYIFILYLTPGFNRLGKDNCKTRRETFNFRDLVRLILDIYGTDINRESKLRLHRCHRWPGAYSAAIIFHLFQFAFRQWVIFSYITTLII